MTVANALARQLGPQTVNKKGLELASEYTKGTTFSFKVEDKAPDGDFLVIDEQDEKGLTSQFAFAVEEGDILNTSMSPKA